ncbi:hypothetical protein Ahy_B06g080894 isoform E [Arachis hypogaea]|uniref:Pentatricopeptide repeat-containing protein n=1 Tax=Arachis hypogaea TaxID=3818 RepID=A0A444YJC5_ARAHY|nr:hypothetical protein Ahy_B06g080894 isoform E [Arachis hypogaea]
MEVVASWTKALCVDISQGRIPNHVDDVKAEASELGNKVLSSWSVLDIGTRNSLLLQELAKQGFSYLTDIKTKSIAANYYILSCQLEKAKVILKEIEADDLRGRYWLERHLLPLYAKLGKEKRVIKIGIQAYGILGKVNEAAAVFEMMKKGRLLKIFEGWCDNVTDLLLATEEEAILRYKRERRLQIAIIHGMARMAAMIASTYRAYLGVGLGPLENKLIVSTSSSS